MATNYNNEAPQFRSQSMARAYQNIQAREYKEQGLNADGSTPSRSALDRFFDALQVGQYASAGFFKGIADGAGGLTPWEGLTGGLRAANPFGHGYEQGEHSFSQVLDEAGWQPETLAGKAVRGTVGFIGDVALDPLTYATFGASAVVKGTGTASKIGKATTVFTREMAEKAMVNMGREITEDGVIDLMSKVNKVKGVNLDPKGIGILGKEIVSGKTLAEFGDKTIAPYTQDFISAFKQSKVTEKLSTKAPLFKEALKNNDTALSQYFMFMDDVSKSGANRAMRKTLVKKYTDELSSLNPDVRKTITGILEDDKLWAPGKKTFASTEEADQLRDTLRDWIHTYEDRFIKPNRQYGADVVAEANIAQKRQSFNRKMKTNKFNAKINQESVEKTGKKAIITPRRSPGDTMNYGERLLKTTNDYQIDGKGKIISNETGEIVGELHKKYSVAAYELEKRGFLTKKKGKLKKSKAGANKVVDAEVVTKTFEDGTTKVQGVQFNPMDYSNSANKTFQEKVDFINEVIYDGEEVIWKGAPGRSDFVIDKLIQGIIDGNYDTQVNNFHIFFDEHGYNFNKQVNKMLGATGKKVRDKPAKLQAQITQLTDDINFKKIKPENIKATQKQIKELTTQRNAASRVLDKRNKMISQFKNLDDKAREEMVRFMENQNIYDDLADMNSDAGQLQKEFDRLLSEDYQIKRQDMSEAKESFKKLTQTEKEAKELARVLKNRGFKYTNPEDAQLQLDNLVELGRKSNSERVSEYLTGTGATDIKINGVPVAKRTAQKALPKYSDDLAAKLVKNSDEISSAKNVIGNIEVKYKNGSTKTFSKDGFVKEFREELGFKETKAKSASNNVKLKGDGSDTVSYKYKNKTVTGTVDELNKTALAGYKAEKRQIQSELKEMQGIKDFIARRANPKETAFQNESRKRYGFSSVDEAEFKLKELREDIKSLDETVLAKHLGYEDLKIEGKTVTFTHNGTKTVRPLGDARTYVKDQITEQGMRVKGTKEQMQRELGEFRKTAPKEMTVEAKLKELETLSFHRKSYSEVMARNAAALGRDGAAVPARRNIYDSVKYNVKKGSLDKGKVIEGTFQDQYVDEIGETIRFNRTIEGNGQSIREVMEDTAKSSVEFDDGILEKYVQRYDMYKKALRDNELLESIAIAKHGTNYVEGAVGRERAIAGLGGPGPIPLNEANFDPQAKSVARFIKDAFGEVAEQEVEAGVLKQGQVDNMKAYVAHILTPEAKAKLIKETGEPNGEFDDVLKWIVDDDAAFNEFALGRKLKKGVTIGNKTLETGSIDEINEVFQDLLGDKLFQDDISDIFIHRMDTHYDVMYDYEVTKKALEGFGQKFNPDGSIPSTHRATVNLDAINLSDNMVEKKNFLRDNGFGDQVDNMIGARMIRMDEATAKKYQYKFGSDDVYAMPDLILNKLNTVANVQAGKDTSAFLRQYDKFLSIWRVGVTTNPSFHSQNLIGNTFQNWLALGNKALDPKLQKNSYDLLKGVKTGTMTLGDVDYDMDFIRAAMKEYGVFDAGLFEKEIGNWKDTGMLKKYGVDPKFDPTDVKNFVPYQKSRTIGNTVENHARITNFIAGLDNGMSISEAAEQVNKFLFDYSDLTEFEMTTMRRVFPFYTWMRKNVPLQVEQMLTNPDKYRAVAKAFGTMEDMNDEKIAEKDRPMYSRDWVQLPFSWKGGDGQEKAMFWNPNLPFMDVNLLPITGQGVKKLFSRTSPLISQGVEQSLNKNIYFNKSLEEMYPTSSSPRLEHFLGTIPNMKMAKDLSSKTGASKVAAGANAIGLPKVSVVNRYDRKNEELYSRIESLY